MTNSKGYLLGKLFAHMEREGAVVASSYQTASVAPTGVLVPAFTRLAEAGKLDAIAEVMSELPMDAFADGPLSAEDQAGFPLGYYQEKARMVRADEPDQQEERYSAHLLVRLQPSLKAWVMEQGGSEFVRRLLRTERKKK